MRRKLTFLLVVLFGCSVFAQMDTLDKKLQSLFSKYKLMGMSVAVVKGDSVIFSKGYGKKDNTRNLPVDLKTSYRIASISKTFTSAALMSLYDKGKFKLDDDISAYLGFSVRNPKFPNDVITFRKVLSHTSSLRDGTGYDGFLSATYSSAPPDLKTLLLPAGTYYTSDMWSASQGPSSNYFTYANINFGLAGTLVEKLSGERFDIYCKKNIFAPLGLDASFNIQDLTDINNLAVIYRPSGSSWSANADNYGGVKPVPIDLSKYVPGTNGVIYAPQGGVRISASDLSVFMIMLKNNGIYKGIRILSDSTAKLMKKDVWVKNGSNGDAYYGIFNKYSLGISNTTELLKGESLTGHPGEAYGLISDMYFSADKNYGIVFITNGGTWGDGLYSGWYNIEEDIYNEALKALTNAYTPADPELLNENFESIKSSGEGLTGWTFNNAQTWMLSGYGHNSDKYAGWDESHIADHWITSPKLNSPANLSFWIAAYNSSSKFDVKLQVSTDGSAWVDKAVYKSKGAGGDIGLDFINKTLSLQLSGSYFLRWSTANYESGGFYIDDIVVTGKPTGVKNEGVSLKTFALEQNFPNPFNPVTTIGYYLPNSAHVTLKIYDILGREIKTLVNGQMNPGSYSVVVSTENMSSGVYVYRLQAGEFTSARKMTLIK